MYPCCYSNYYYPTIFDTKDYEEDMHRTLGTTTKVGGTTMPGGMMPGSMGMPMGPMMGMPMQGPMQPVDELDEPIIEPVPGTTAGLPVESVTPAPITVPTPVDFTQEEGSPVTTDIQYTQAYLRSKIGKQVRIDFLIGTNLLTDRAGTLVDVGISYVILRLAETDDLMLGDIYSIKFVTFFE